MTRQILVISIINHQHEREYTFEFLDELPAEIRSMIFEYMVQGTVQEHNLVLDIWDVERHLDCSPWITLNKKYCAEYLRVFLKQVELRRNVTRITRCNPTGPGAPTKIQMFDSCLQTIDRRLKTATSQTDLKEPLKEFYVCMKGICLSYDDTYFRHGYGWAQPMYQSIEYSIEDPLNQLRSYHDNYNIPANKISISISYGNPDMAFSAFVERQLSHDETDDFKTTLHSIKAKIWVADYDASVTAIDEALQSFRKALDKRFEETHALFPKPTPTYGDVSTLERRIENETEKIRELHLMTIDKITKFWKARDGGYEADIKFGTKYWTRKQRSRLMY